MKKKLISGVFGLLILGGVIAQIFPPASIDGPLDAQLDISNDPSVPTEVVAALRKGCYDCHSNEPQYPAYAGIGMVKYYLNNHIKGGNKHLNFSVWNDYSTEKKIHKKEEICEEIEENNMPLWNYALLHKEAVLSQEEQNIICQWVNGE